MDRIFSEINEIRLPAKPAFPINGATTTTTVGRWELGMTVFKLLGGRGSVGVRGMTVSAD